jgi:hypothetical protein
MTEPDVPESYEATRAPRTEAERQQVLLQRPRAWEYFYFAGELLNARDSMEDKYRDHQMRVATRSGEPLAYGAVPGALVAAADDAKYLAITLDRAMSQEAQARAFGAPGEPGDAGNLLHLARRWNDVYVGFLDWAAKIRGLRAPSEFDEARELLARYADAPISDYREFVDKFVAQVDTIPAALASGEPMRIEITLTLRIPSDVSDAFMKELERLMQLNNP